MNFGIEFRKSKGTIYLLQGRSEAKIKDQRSLGDLRSRRTVFCSIVLSSARLSGLKRSIIYTKVNNILTGLSPKFFKRIQLQKGIRVAHYFAGLAKEE
jgi:hypothetical protein